MGNGTIVGWSEYLYLGALSMGQQLNLIENLGVKGWPFNLGGFGLNILFYQSFWDALGYGLINAIRNLWMFNEREPIGFWFT
jgi:hypothetical protein